MARIGKRSGSNKVKPAEKKVARAAPLEKDCCGAKRGHKSTCKMLLASERGDDHGIERIDPTEPDPGQAGAVDLMDEESGLSSVAAGTDQTTLFAILRGVEESLSRIADYTAAIVGCMGSPQATPAAPRAARKPKAAPLAPSTSTGTGEYITPPPPDDAGAVDLMDDAPPPPAPPKAAPPAKAAPTLDEVRTAFLGFASRKGRDAAVGLLSRFNAAKLGDVDAKHYPAILAAVKEG